MKHYINKNKEIFGFELDGSQDHLITRDMTPITVEVIQAIHTDNEEKYKQTTEYKIREANTYLRETDWIKSYLLEHKLGSSIIPEDSSKWLIINTRQSYIDFLKGL